MKTKKIAFILLTVAVAASTALTFQSCSDRENLQPNTVIAEKYKNSIKEVSKSEIPEGVTPIVLKSKDELYSLVEKLNSLELKVVPQGKFKRFKVFPETGSTSTITNLSNNSDYNITITLAWSEIGGPITVESHNTNTWWFSSWTQNTGVASWNGSSRINYNITGTLKFFVLIEADFFEVKRTDMTVSGYVNG